MISFIKRVIKWLKENIDADLKETYEEEDIEDNYEEIGRAHV